MRPELLTPAHFGEDAGADRNRLSAILGLIGVDLEPRYMTAWTTLEIALAYDWASREHLRASDNRVKTRDKPSFIAAAEERSKQARAMADNDEAARTLMLLYIISMDPSGPSAQQIRWYLQAKNMPRSREVIQQWIFEARNAGLVKVVMGPSGGLVCSTDRLRDSTMQSEGTAVPPVGLLGAPRS